jgi:uncharacterized protein with PIN domain
MTLQVAAPMRFFHERYFGRPSCPKCGELMIAPEYPEFIECRSGNEVRNFWRCDGCKHSFDTLVKFRPAVA